jgi:hypothetical protein
MRKGLIDIEAIISIVIIIWLVAIFVLAIKNTEWENEDTTRIRYIPMYFYFPR